MFSQKCFEMAFKFQKFKNHLVKLNENLFSISATIDFAENPF